MHLPDGAEVSIIVFMTETTTIDPVAELEGLVDALPETLPESKDDAGMPIEDMQPIRECLQKILPKGGKVPFVFTDERGGVLQQDALEEGHETV
jgi:hypothetical protein